MTDRLMPSGASLSRMELTGALSNRCLSREARLAEQLVCGPAAAEPVEVPRRTGTVKAAILHVLAGADARGAVWSQ
jgi:hypothetical protein